MTYSSMFSSARIGEPAATWPTSGSPSGYHDVLDRADRAVQQLDRPRLRRVAAQQPDLLEVREMGVHRRGRGQPDRLADVTHRRRIAVLRRVLLDEVEDLLLALRQVLADVHGRGLLRSPSRRVDRLERTCVRKCIAPSGRTQTGSTAGLYSPPPSRRWRNW